MSLLNEINKEDITCSWIGKSDIIKINILPRVIYIFNAIPFKAPPNFSKEIINKLEKFAGNKKSPGLSTHS